MKRGGLYTTPEDQGKSPKTTGKGALLLEGLPLFFPPAVEAILAGGLRHLKGNDVCSFASIAMPVCIDSNARLFPRRELSTPSLSSFFFFFNK